MGVTAWAGALVRENSMLISIDARAVVDVDLGLAGVDRTRSVGQRVDRRLT